MNIRSFFRYKQKKCRLFAEEDRVTIDYVLAVVYTGLWHNLVSVKTPDIPALLAKINYTYLHFDPMQTTFFLGENHLVESPAPNMLPWRKRLFLFMSHNALSATNFFNLPIRVVELGTQIALMMQVSLLTAWHVPYNGVFGISWEILRARRLLHNAMIASAITSFCKYTFYPP